VAARQAKYESYEDTQLAADANLSSVAHDVGQSTITPSPHVFRLPQASAQVGALPISCPQDVTHRAGPIGVSLTQT
jgi:hypothetical protein